jgi:hypothetical protein
MYSPIFKFVAIFALRSLCHELDWQIVALLCPGCQHFQMGHPGIGSAITRYRKKGGGSTNQAGAFSPFTDWRESIFRAGSMSFRDNFEAMVRF